MGKQECGSDLSVAISVLKLKTRTQIAKQIRMSEEETEGKGLNKPSIFSFLLSLLPFF
jgi:hypothetical protein